MSVQPKLWQPKQPVFWLWLVLCSLAGAFAVFELVVIASQSSVPAVSAAIVLLLVQAAIFWSVLRLLPRVKRQPMSLQVAALVWGLTANAGLAILANSSYSEPLQGFGLASFSASLSAPINEDAFRLLGVLVVLILAYAQRITVMDGVIYGFLVGAGFELFENLLYALQGDDFGTVIQSGITRLLMGFGLHALWTAIAAAALAYCLSRRQQHLGGRWWVLVPAVVLPMALHAAWDAPAISVLAPLVFAVYIVLYALSLGAFLMVVRWGRRSEYASLAAGNEALPSYREFTRLPKAERRGKVDRAVAKDPAPSEVS